MSVQKYRVRKGDHYTVIANHVIKTLKGNLEALGLYTYLLSLPESWEFHKSQLRDACNIGVNKLDNLLSFLSKHDLVKIIPIRNEKGQFVFFDLVVLDGGSASSPMKTIGMETMPMENSTYKRNTNKEKKEQKKDNIYILSGRSNFTQPYTNDRRITMSSNFYTINIKAILEIRDDYGEITAKLSPESDVVLTEIGSNYATSEVSSSLSVVSAKPNVAPLVADYYFHEFWQAYPRKEQKKEAYKIWTRDKLELIGEKIIDDVRLRQIKHDRWSDRSYIPMPSTYLRNEGWTDEITERTKNEHNLSTKASDRHTKESKRAEQIRRSIDEYERRKALGE